MTLMNPINGRLVNTTLINAGKEQWGKLSADNTVETLVTVRLVTTTGLLVHVLTELAAECVIGYTSHVVPIEVDAYMINKDLPTQKVITDEYTVRGHFVRGIAVHGGYVDDVIPDIVAATNIVARTSMEETPADIVTYATDIEAVTGFDATATYGQTGNTDILSRTWMQDTEYDVVHWAWFCENSTSMDVPVVIGQNGSTQIEAVTKVNPWGSVVSTNATKIQVEHDWPELDPVIFVNGAVKLDDCNCDCVVYGPNLTFPPEGCHNA